MTKYAKYLTEKTLPHYLNIIKDEDFGGIFTEFDPDANVTSTKKHCWYFGRDMWSYSMAYLHVERRKEYLDICEHILQFLKKIEYVDNRFPLWVTRDGQFTGEVKGVYNEGFIAMGCAQYYKATGNKDAKAIAEKCFDIMYDGYFGGLEKQQNNKTEPVPCKVFGFNMAMLVNAQFVRSAGIRVKEANELAEKCVERMMNVGHVDDEKKMVLEYFPLPGYEVTREMAHTCPGHVYEAAWFVLCEGEYRNNDEMRLFGKKLLDYAMPEGFEEKTALIPTAISPYEPHNFERSNTILAWPQQEAVTAYTLAYLMFGDEKYKRLANMIEKAAEEYFVDEELGRWYRDIKITDPKAKDRSEKGTHCAGPFHLERMLLAMDILVNDKSIKRYIF
ncbi:MAG: AGE family epimerase/isomerase [Clostridia bacterium]|nr:AGE family epimerase/isomerase [Clostridia bacterium]